MFNRFRRFANLKLGGKFLLIHALLLVGGIIIGALAVWVVVQGSAESEYTTRGTILMQLIRGVRTYTSDRVSPLLKDKNAASSTFIAESVPAFSANQVFANFRQQYPEFHYKEASSNPTNPADKADDFETGIVNRLDSDRTIAWISGYRSLNGQQVYFIAMPLPAGKSCLACHSTPDVAPKNLINTYGSQNGFGWKLNQVIAAQVVYVPANDILTQILSRFPVFMLVFIVIFGLAIVLVNFTLSRYVIQPVGMLGGLAEKIAQDKITPDDLRTAEFQEISSHKDELGELAQVFQNMARQVYERTEGLRQQVSMLNIQIDEIKRQQQVAEVVGSESFRDLQSKARELRKQRQESEAQSSGNESTS